MSRQEFASYMIENPADFYYGVLWNKMYRRSIIEEYHIRMDTSISWCEDFLFNLEYIRHAESFFALQVPIYYYLKRRGSLVSQGASITNTVRMKSNIFEYYNEFYKDVYEDKDYADIRLQVYSFLWAAAKDGGVLPGSKKLGEERRRITREEVEGNGAVIGQYRFLSLIHIYKEAVKELIAKILEENENRREGLTVQKRMLMAAQGSGCLLYTSSG